MAITPGKIGELSKSYFVKTITGEGMSKMTPIVMVERFTDLLAVTDHDTIKGGQETKSAAEDFGSPVEVVVGAEIRTAKGDIIGLGLEREIQSSELHGAVEEIKGQGEELYIPHPFDKLRSSALGLDVLEVVERVDYIEVFNGRCLLNSFDQRSKDFSEQYGLKRLAGSDAHFGFEMGNLSPGFGKFMKTLIAHTLTKTGLGY